MNDLPLLVSVRNTDEAQLVAQYPIAILDFKEPAAGALGAVPIDILQTALTRLPALGATKLSMAAGELLDWKQDADWLPRHQAILNRISYCKLGLANTSQNGDWQAEWNRFADQLPHPTQPVLVGYLDYHAAGSPLPSELIAFAQSHPKCHTVLWDTWGKQQTLFDEFPIDQLKTLLNECRTAGLRTVLAGSIGMETVEQAWGLEPDLIGVRGAVCVGSRRNAIASQRLSELIMRLEDVCRPDPRSQLSPAEGS